MVEMRLDRRLQARLDASDIIQDAYLEVAQRLKEYLRDPRVPVFLWLRLVVGDWLEVAGTIYSIYLMKDG